MTMEVTVVVRNEFEFVVLFFLEFLEFLLGTV
jgi:hypothetical protein